MLVKLILISGILVIFTPQVIGQRSECVNEDFITGREGFRTTGYVPTSNGVPIEQSGVTIGRGVDIGQHSRQDFEKYGVDESVIVLCEPYFQLKGEAALTKLNDLNAQGKPLRLDNKTAWELSYKVFDGKVEKMKDKYNKNSAKIKWKHLTNNQRTVIVSVLYQHGLAGAPRFFGYATSQNWKAVIYELRHFSTNPNYKFKDRRELEAQYLENDNGANCNICNESERRKRQSENLECLYPTYNTGPSVSACEKYGDIRMLRPTGAKAGTARQDKLNVVGVAASNMLLDTDLEAIEVHKTCFKTTGVAQGIHPALIAALASRESRVGKALDENGYGDHGNGYGIMQCDITKNPQLNCEQYGPRSCEHINQLIEKILVRDIISVQHSHPSWEPHEQIQGAVAAYNFGVRNVWSKPGKGLDGGTTGDDYSNDVIARAQRLISAHNWQCEISEGSSTSTPATTSPRTGNCWTMAREGNCEFYNECVEKVVACGEDGYAVGYGYKYCNRFAQFYDGFDTIGKDWIDKVRICLMEFLLPRIMPGVTCKQIKEMAFASHVKCYKESGAGICEVVKSGQNRDSLLDVYEFSDFIGKEWKEAWAQVFKTVGACTIYYNSQIATEVKEFVDDRIEIIKETISDAIEAVGDWVDKFTERIGRKKRSLLESDCEDYAQNGDCRFYECFENKFPCAKYEGYSHVKDFELTSCMTFNVLKANNAKVSEWMVNLQKCMMSHLNELYQQTSLHCIEIELRMHRVRVDCMVNSGYCPLTDAADEWMIERGTDMKGFPFILPVGYTTLPLSKGTTMINEFYYQVLQEFKDQLGQANEVCYQRNERDHANLYRFEQTKYGLLKFRNDGEL